MIAQGSGGDLADSPPGAYSMLCTAEGFMLLIRRKDCRFEQIEELCSCFWLKGNIVKLVNTDKQERKQTAGRSNTNTSVHVVIVNFSLDMKASQNEVGGGLICLFLEIIVFTQLVI